MKLYYFNVRNLAEPIRCILHYLEIPFEDIRVEMNDWPALKKSFACCLNFFDIAFRNATRNFADIGS